MGIISYIVVSTVGGVAAMVGAPAALAILGFSATGVVAGSLAAGAQGYIGSVTAGTTAQRKAWINYTQYLYRLHVSEIQINDFNLRAECYKGAFEIVNFDRN
ncbi:18706_t:CDS:2 [Funneliformis geosporum]|uniref:13882_t:CDS:1 n=1 Tax=Funneliformis geosporum TaxID=1117311 RepID=A0A9W4SD34_9GLOM|nr:13882_t:CDS:2 [Funneliformis geosporum]CAI2182013.1 18706_t:CDS:2 [Funneliformis geosporum]